MSNITNLVTNIPINAGGLNPGTNEFITNWIQPAFIFCVILGVVGFAVTKKIRELVGFLILAAIIGAVVFFADDIFGKDGSLTGVTAREAKKINTILPSSSITEIGDGRIILPDK